METSEEHRPSLKKAPKTKAKGLPFYVSVQHVKNAQLMLQCKECNMWRLVYSKYKLSVAQCRQLQRLLDDYSYSCGAKLEELDLGEGFKNVEVRDHACGDPIEKLYYLAGLSPYVCTVELTSHSSHLSSTLSVKHALIFHLSRSNLVRNFSLSRFCN